jgi:hypothetical protein
MTPEKTEALKAHLKAIAAILYEETPPEKINTLEEIEQTVRQKVLKHVSPEIGVFLFNRSQVQPQAEKDA